ncbi:hypothetical protein LJR129_003582 [Acidovorax sp. LjRoot129]|uniref:hypothetical protein n=1 Tax=Acidovorax sp. LjRoot129 TaxID=3342260 RepID=UPI003ECE1F8C
MPFEFDLHGWFAGGVAEPGLRTVTAAPPSQSTTTTEGEPRANWSGVAWVMRPYVAPSPEPEAPAVAAPRIVSVLGFRRRFTPAEKAAIEWAAVDRPDQPDALRMQAAALRATLADQATAQFIDLEDPATVHGVQGLEALGILAAGRALEILTAPIQPEELP